MGNLVAVITGAASGIGAGLAGEAVRRGFNVVLADRDGERLAAVAAELGAAAIAVTTDVTQRAALETLAARAYEAFGQVDLLFNNAGVLHTGLCWELEEAAWQTALTVNVGGIVNGLAAFVPRLIAAGRPARIINTASVGGFLPSPFMAPYSATKFAVVALTESLAHELAAVAPHIAVSLLAPGPVRSGIFRLPPTEASLPFHAEMTRLLGQHGMQAAEFAGLVFDAIEAGQYWIVPQPEILDGPLAARQLMISTRASPTATAAAFSSQDG